MARFKNLKVFCASPDTSHLSNLCIMQCNIIASMYWISMHTHVPDLSFHGLLEVHYSIMDEKPSSFISDHSLL